MSNRLARETSPYLLQHADNPVEWYPWGAEALEKAKAEDKPIFLSIGYSACHWCHVMEHESFEDEQLAAEMSEKFVCIKVDREERPDLDQIYMNAVQMLTGSGGWPMSVFLTPQLQPFYGGTYWPPHARMGMPGFDQVLQAVSEAWQQRRELVQQQAGELTQRLQQWNLAGQASGALQPELIQGAVGKLEQAFDFQHGGFGRAPKFPHPMDLQLLLRAWRRWQRPGLLEMVTLTLDKMARGGIYDHLGGGFHRYSVDQRWLVPHFEKMLYDNGLLANAYLDGFLATGNPEYARIVQETLDYILNDMTDPQGGFHSTEDADSEGVEGKFYVWTPGQIVEVLGPEIGERFCYVYDVTPGGNFEDLQSILNLPKTIEQCAALRGWDPEQLGEELAESRQQLLAARDQRVRPAKDDKILVSWNALAIDAMARAAGILGQPKYLAAATKAAEFLVTHVKRPDGRLLHSWRHGQARFDAYLDDYTYLIHALVSLYEAGFQERWIEEAVQLADTVLQHFADPEQGDFFYTADDHEELIARQKDFQDSSVPSSNAMAATGLLRLGKLCGRSDYLEAARRTATAATALMQQAPTAAGQMLVAVDMLLGPLPEIVILGDPDQPETAAALADLHSRFLPNRVLACRAQPEPPAGAAVLQPLFAGKQPQQPPPTVFICENFTCQEPVTGKEAAIASWGTL